VLLLNAIYIGGALGANRQSVCSGRGCEDATYWRKDLELFRAYFREVNISERLADDMMRTAPSQVYWLSPEEIEAYGLGGERAGVPRNQNTRQAQKYGLSRTESETRLKLAQQICPVNGPTACVDDVMKGNVFHLWRLPSDPQ